MKSKLLMVVGLALALAACGGADDGETAADAGAVADRCTEDRSLCTTFHVPADFAGTPRQIIIGLYESLPPQGPPLVVVAIIETPAIGVDQPFEVTATDIDMEQPEDYFLYAVLYVEGGGQFVPEPGIDYTAQTTSKQRMGAAAVNMPDMTFALAQE